MLSLSKWANQEESKRVLKFRNAVSVFYVIAGVIRLIPFYLDSIVHYLRLATFEGYQSL